MDILIKNMEMPSDEKHSVVLVFGKDGFEEARDSYSALKIEGITAVALPEHHGRLIDADALLPKSGYDPMMFKHKYDGDHRTQYDTLMGYEILGIVENAQTIVEASNGTDS